MSARKRRNASKILMLVRMDATRSRMDASFSAAIFSGTNQAMTYWETCMVPLGNALTRLGLKDRAIGTLKAARGARIATGGKE